MSRQLGRLCLAFLAGFFLLLYPGSIWSDEARLDWQEWIQFLDSRPLTTEEIIWQTAVFYGVDPYLVLAVAQTESRMQQDAISHKGAIGVMQLMPPTAQELGVDPHVLEENIDGGVRYLGQLLRRYDGDIELALAAYNAGIGRVDRFGGIPPFAETQRYVKIVVARYHEFRDRAQES